MCSTAARFVVCCSLAAWLLPAVVPAANCTPTMVSPAVCHPAHADPPKQHPSGGDCALDSMGICVPTTGTRCIDRYATAVAGVCAIELNYSNPTGCTWDHGVTVVDLPKYLAACSAASGVCQCEYTRDTGTTPAQVEVCDCDEYAL
jgi:hypothetical protein